MFLRVKGLHTVGIAICLSYYLRFQQVTIYIFRLQEDSRKLEAGTNDFLPNLLGQIK